MTFVGNLKIVNAMVRLNHGWTNEFIHKNKT